MSFSTPPPAWSPFPGIVMTGIHGMAMTQSTLQNRTEMHANVRSATELLQQEIGQAGRVCAEHLHGESTTADFRR